MTKQRILFAEDDERTRVKIVESLRTRGWVVETAANGEEALEKLTSPQSAYDLLLLDLRMPKMTGEQVLISLRERGPRVPIIVVLSAYLDEATIQKCIALGVDLTLKKPQNPAHLEIDFLDTMVKKRAAALRDWLGRDTKKNTNKIGRKLTAAKEPLFVVARRWNSWYPSVFPAVGGAYAVVGPREAAGPGISTSARLHGAVIDPGFQFMKVFTEMGLPWKDFENCVITHNHPDHMGGIFEFMAARHALGKQTRVLCSSSCCTMLGDCSGFNLDVKELDERVADLLLPYQSGGHWLRVRTKGFATAHEEIGRENSSIGLSIIFDKGADRNDLQEASELILLGDTEYERAEHKRKFMTTLCKPNVKVVVLHIGSSQLKQETGKHLYFPGIERILMDMESELSEITYHGTMLVLVSEWGLEHATKEQITKVCGHPLPGFSSHSPIIETITYLQRGLKKIHLVPADIGLVVGIESANVYLEGGVPFPPEEVLVTTTDEGLKYEAIGP
jgi:CheY-like chemotaxis protein